MPIPELIAIPFSPWSEKARWALDHHRVDYHEKSYTPILGELALRVQLLEPFGRITVPVLREGRRWLRDSFEIAVHAERIGRGTTLFPSAASSEISAWNDRSEVALAAGRVILMRDWVRTPELELAALPAGIPAPIASFLRPVGRWRLDNFMKKYSVAPEENEASPETALRRALDDLEQALAGRRYLIGDALSYADIAMALTLQQVKPVDPAHIPRLDGLGPAGMNVPELEGRYAGLIAWRDELYARHRRPDSVGRG